MKLGQAITSVPVLGPVVRRIYRAFSGHPKPFSGSKHYWKNRYESGGSSGHGSRNRLAGFKAELINSFVIDKHISSIIEYGCGDGNQLRLARYPTYIGFDVSPDAISRCLRRFDGDELKSFKLMEEYRGEVAELTLSLDVIYHLTEDAVFIDYMNRLFDSSERFVIIYSSDTDENPEGTPLHVKHRNFSRWVEENKRNWVLLQYIPNRYPFEDDERTGSFADFFIYEKR